MAAIVSEKTPPDGPPQQGPGATPAPGSAAVIQLAIQGPQRRLYLQQTAYRLYLAKVSAGAILAALAHENKFRCDPPLERDELNAIFEKTQHGGESPRTTPAMPTLAVGAVQFCEDFKPHTDIVEKLLRGQYIYSLTAPTNAGKTALFIHLATCIALGDPFAGRKVKRGRVAILCGENPYDVKPRLLAQCQAKNLEIGDLAEYVYVIPQSFPMKERIDALMLELADVGEWVAILVDTSAAYFSGDSEDDNVQARDHAVTLRRLTLLPGNPAVIVAAHPTKKASRDELVPRGGGAFINELDGNLTCASGGQGITTLHWHQKLRQPAFDPLDFKLTHIELDGFKYEDGTPYSTIIAESLSEAAAAAMERETTEAENRLLSAMLRAPRGGVREWAQDANLSKSTAHRLIGLMAGEGLVKRYRRHWVLTEAGKKEAKAD